MKNLIVYCHGNVFSIPSLRMCRVHLSMLAVHPIMMAYERSRTGDEMRRDGWTKIAKQKKVFANHLWWFQIVKWKLEKSFYRQSKFWSNAGNVYLFSYRRRWWLTATFIATTRVRYVYLYGEAIVNRNSLRVFTATASSKCRASIFWPATKYEVFWRQSHAHL